jgi:hypothetical protein
LSAGRTFTSLEHLNEMASCWLAETADVRVHQETKGRPIDLFAEEKPLLLALPARPPARKRTKLNDRSAALVSPTSPDSMPGKDSRLMRRRSGREEKLPKKAYI